MTGEESRKKVEIKRSRIRSIKRSLFGFLLLWTIVSSAIIAYLTLRVISLENQIKEFDSVNINVTSKRGASYLQNSEDTGIINKNGDLIESNKSTPSDETFKVYLTFDDGPSENTEEILNILDDYGVKATFFVQGKNDEKSLELIKRMHDEGHTIGMHSYSHKYNEIYKSLDSFVSDFNKIEDLIYSTTGNHPTFYRFPGGSSTGVANGKMIEFIKYLDDEGITYVDWNVSSNDATAKPLSSDTIVENVMKDVLEYKTSIVLMHDTKERDTTVNALSDLIEKLRENKAVLLPITEDTTLIQHVTLNYR